MTLNPLVWALAAVAVLSEVAAHSQLRSIKRRIYNMPLSKAEQEAFDTLNAKADALGAANGSLFTAVTGLTTEIAAEKQALADALAGQNEADIVAAATALSTKLDGATATAQSALTAAQAALTPASPPVAPAVDQSAPSA